ncbi:hypothetical protein GGR33_004978 [Methylobacterium brachythecii]|uniref:Uncharacterized protein n=1 Tax=Methylobacterium brachythecii TaxID=1176177 RepID=A0A7W6AL55_9HYPH|nr:hypothetical protein [Methylobacterium brachythecii]GLS44921.1 hypothetical protein GCM10007884_29100 [Methylobacterium brachythecii]
MAGRLLRCKRCRQPILSDARCCPHCALALPVRRFRASNVLIAVILIAAAAWLVRSNGTTFTSGVTSVIGSATTALKTVDGPPDTFSAACSRRGGTVVEARSRDGVTLRRCALSFDDDVR